MIIKLAAHKHKKEKRDHPAYSGFKRGLVSGATIGGTLSGINGVRLASHFNMNPASLGLASAAAGGITYGILGGGIGAGIGGIYAATHKKDWK